MAQWEFELGSFWLSLLYCTWEWKYKKIILAEGQVMRHSRAQSWSLTHPRAGFINNCGFEIIYVPISVSSNLTAETEFKSKSMFFLYCVHIWHYCLWTIYHALLSHCVCLFKLKQHWRRRKEVITTGRFKWDLESSLPSP